MRRLYEYWTKLKGDRFAPARSEINPADMKDQLGWVWFMEVVDGGDDFRFRLGGDRVIQFFGQRLAGLTIKEITPKSPAFFGRFMDLAQMATLKRHPVIGGPSQTEYEPRSFLEVEGMLLPLSEDGKNVTHLLGCIDIRPLVKAAEPRD